MEKQKEQPEITFTFFMPDSRKNGGKYVDITGVVKKIDEIERCVRLMDGTRILINDIYEISGDIFTD